MSKNSDFLDFTLSIAKEAGDIQMSYFGKVHNSESKSTNIDLLTEVDKKSEMHIISNIKKKFPDHSILSEEKGEIDNQSEYLWVIDPLDGTTNFVHNLPIFAVSIGLQKNNKTILGVVYNPAADKCFYAEYSKGAYLNDNIIMTRENVQLSKSLLATGFPYIHDKKYDISFNLFKHFYDETRGVRRLGAASLDLCFVAMGRFDGYYEFGLKPWDICAGSLIVNEAKGIVSDWNGEKVPFSGNRILACSNNEIHNNMKKILMGEKYSLFF